MEVRKDMCIGTENCSFTLRTAAIIIKDERLLVAKHDDLELYYTVGGGVKMNESSEEAVLREILEETGVRASVGRLAYVQERFYEAGGKAHHEVTFFYLIDSANFSVEDGTCTDNAHEHLFWFPLEQLPNLPLVPEFLRKGLEDIPTSIQHIVSKEVE